MNYELIRDLGGKIKSFKFKGQEYTLKYRLTAYDVTKLLNDDSPIQLEDGTWFADVRPEPTFFEKLSKNFLVVVSGQSNAYGYDTADEPETGHYELNQTARDKAMVPDWSNTKWMTLGARNFNTGQPHSRVLNKATFGAWAPFSNELTDIETTEKVRILNQAKGGDAFRASLLAFEDDGYQPGKMYRRLQMDLIKAEIPEDRTNIIFYHQGEGDMFQGTNGTQYYNALVNYVISFREHLFDDKALFLIGKPMKKWLDGSSNKGSITGTIQKGILDQYQRVADALPYCIFIDSDDILEEEGAVSMKDNIHFGATMYRNYGKKYFSHMVDRVLDDTPISEVATVSRLVYTTGTVINDEETFLNNEDGIKITSFIDNDFSLVVNVDGGDSEIPFKSNTVKTAADSDHVRTALTTGDLTTFFGTSAYLSDSGRGFVSVVDDVGSPLSSGKSIEETIWIPGKTYYFPREYTPGKTWRSLISAIYNEDGSFTNTEHRYRGGGNHPETLSPSNFNVIKTDSSSLTVYGLLSDVRVRAAGNKVFTNKITSTDGDKIVFNRDLKITIKAGALANITGKSTGRNTTEDTIIDFNDLEASNQLFMDATNPLDELGGWSNINYVTQPIGDITEFWLAFSLFGGHFSLRIKYENGKATILQANFNSYRFIYNELQLTNISHRVGVGSIDVPLDQMVVPDEFTNNLFVLKDDIKARFYKVDTDYFMKVKTDLEVLENKVQIKEPSLSLTTTIDTGEELVFKMKDNNGFVSGDVKTQWLTLVTGTDTFDTNGVFSKMGELYKYRKNGKYTFKWVLTSETGTVNTIIWEQHFNPLIVERRLTSDPKFKVISSTLPTDNNFGPLGVFNNTDHLIAGSTSGHFSLVQLGTYNSNKIKGPGTSVNVDTTDTPCVLSELYVIT